MELIIRIGNWISNIISQNFSAVTGFLGVVIGYWLTKRQNVTRRKLEFIEKQIRELYSPLVGMRKEIQILSEFRCTGEEAQKKWWQSISNAPQPILNEEAEKISSQIDYDNRQLIDKIIPEYRKLVNTIRDNFWLAEEETIKQYPILVKFVETWERHLSKTHSREVINSIQVKEDELLNFYKSNDTILKLLKEKIK